MVEDDFIMRQIKLATTGIAQIFKKNVSMQQLGEVKLEDGSVLSREFLIEKYVNEGKFDEAFQLVNALKFKLSYYDFQQVSQWFIALLKTSQKEHQDQLSQDKIEYYKQLLNELL